MTEHDKSLPPLETAATIAAKGAAGRLDRVSVDVDQIIVMVRSGDETALATIAKPGHESGADVLDTLLNHVKIAAEKMGLRVEVFDGP